MSSSGRKQTENASSLLLMTEAERTLALEQFNILRPFLEENVSLTEIAKLAGVSVRTIERWLRRYNANGLAGLCRKVRSDKNTKKTSLSLQQIIEGLALQKPRLSIAAIYRKTKNMASQQGEPVPTYKRVYKIVKEITPSLMTLAHEGTKVYNDTYDLLHRREADGPNAIWQADLYWYQKTGQVHEIK